MNFLIDTQVLIWLINEDGRIGDKTLEKLKLRSNQLKLSYFSIFEMTIKASIGKLDYDPSLINDLTEMDIDLLLPDKTTLQNYMIYNPDNKDPFDNALISVAIDKNYVLVTSDPKILSVSVANLKLLDATK